MLTDIFAYRYLNNPIWKVFTPSEQVLLYQAFGVTLDALPCKVDGKESLGQQAKWEALHDRLARELGVDNLAPRYYSYTTKNALNQDMPVSGYYSIDFVCGSFVKEKYRMQDPDKFIKERLSFIELALRLRGEEIQKANSDLPNALSRASFYESKNPQWGGKSHRFVEQVQAANLAVNSVFRAQVEEINERFRRAKAPLSYHNGFFQLATDVVIDATVAQPFWDLLSSPLWNNVDIDMKEALDQRDANGKDPAFFAAKALESAIKIVSDSKQWTKGTEGGASNYIDNLVSKANGAYLAVWEGEMLKDYFRKVRNSLGHGPGSDPMPSLSLAQTDWAIEAAMSWIRTIVRRM